MRYEHQPARQNHRAATVLLLLLCAAAAAFVGSAFVPAYPIFLQALGLFLLVPFIQVTARYIVLRYLYRLQTGEDGVTDLEIFTYRGGSKMQLVCRVSVSEITAAVPFGPENQKPPHGIRRYNYCPDIGPGNALLLSVSNADGDCEILFCPDEKMRELLVKLLPEKESDNAKTD